MLCDEKVTMRARESVNKGRKLEMHIVMLNLPHDGTFTLEDYLVAPRASQPSSISAAELHGPPPVNAPIYGKPEGARELMFKSTGGYPMATKASGTLVLIIEKQHASWDLMVTASPAMELHSLSVPAPHSLRTVNFGPVGPMCQSGGSCVCRAVLWLAIGLYTARWTAEACLAAAGLMYCESGCRLA